MSLEKPTPEISSLKPHQQRVIDEAIELAIRLSKLQSFINSSPEFTTLSEVNRQLLHRQEALMNFYHAVLTDRIALFNEPA